MAKKTNPIYDDRLRCENCVFYATNRITGKKVCVRYPPMAQLVDLGNSIEFYSFWPEVSKIAICGEYKAASAFKQETP